MDQTYDLNTLYGIVFDCQATHPNPGTGKIMEMAWAVLSPSENPKTSKDDFSRPFSTLINIPTDHPLPRQVKNITGICRADLDNGLGITSAWERLLAILIPHQKENGSIPCPMIIHYARYEEKYLRYLHKIHATPDRSFPFEIICTHQIAARLWPDLPRKGLRAVAGFLGHSVPDKRRAHHHVAATQFIWQEVIKQLSEKENIHTLPELTDWLNMPAQKKAFKNYPMPREKLTKLPSGPGVYYMKRSNSDLLYIGKATSLKTRVRSYFQKKSRHAEHILEMLSQAVDISFTETDTALQAALLETDEIKKKHPPYNKALTEGERDIVFFNHSLQQCTKTISEKATFGPYPSKIYPKAAGHIIRFMVHDRKAPVEKDVISETLATPLVFIPDEETFLSGICLFYDAYHTYFNHADPENVIFLGGIFLKEKKKLSANATEEEATESDSQEDMTAWSPEIVFKRLKAVIRHFSFLTRRGEWYCHLSNAVIMWNRKTKRQREKNCITISDAGISSFETILPHGDAMFEKPPLTSDAGWMRYPNIQDYDRMRVLTTELKRLLKEDRHPCVRTYSGRHFDKETLPDIIDAIDTI